MERSLNIVKEKELNIQSPQRFPLSPEAELQKEYYTENVSRKFERLALMKLPAVVREFGSNQTKFRLTIGASGEVQNIEIMSSSGVEAFDQAIIEIILLLAPFSNFPTALANELDSIEIVKTARYLKKN